jgi:hypothetical protein
MLLQNVFTNGESDPEGQEIEEIGGGTFEFDFDLIVIPNSDSHLFELIALF